MVDKADESLGFTLVVCEKPDAARRVSDALADSKVEVMSKNGVEAFGIRRNGRRFVVCSAAGHLYAVSDPFKNRDVYPVFDLDWFPAHLVNKEARSTERRIAVIRELASHASAFINACDFDVEGETIGYNILRYCCGTAGDDALRAKFSTLTKEELVSAFDGVARGLGKGLAAAGRARHAIDFAWGINLSRALSDSVLLTKSHYRTMSVGRVQSPTLAFVVEREMEIKTFVPLPYWTIGATLEKDGRRFVAAYAAGKVLKRDEAELVKKSCEGKSATVSKMSRSVFRQPPPPPFNTGDLQRESYRVFGYTPSRTLQIAERLYLGALISYPRTSSQKIPPSIDCRRILARLGEREEYEADVKELLKGRLAPHQGEMSDSAHPAIYPTGEVPGRLLAWERRLYDLVARRFLAAFGPDAIRERSTAEIDVSGHGFRVNGRRTLSSGWMHRYRTYSEAEDDVLPPFEEGERLSFLGVDVEEKFERGPFRYNQSSLLEKMEREGIGTKATRADTISTLVSRGYVSGQSMEATELGFSVVEAMRDYSPKVISTELTHETEKRLEEVELGKADPGRLVAETVETLFEQMPSFKANEAEIGGEIDGSILATTSSQYVLGGCPVCKTGKLRIIRSAKTRKRFVGCSNYPNGCRASAPLPQRGSLTVARRSCKDCGWPIVYVRMGRRPWRLCVNVNCPSKGERRREMFAVPERGS